MPDIKIIADKKKILPKDTTVVAVAESLLTKTAEEFINADMVDTINDITVLRSAKAIIQSELDVLQPQIEAIETQIDALVAQIDTLIGERPIKIKSYESKIKEILSAVAVEDKVGVDPSDLAPNASRFLIVNKSSTEYLPGPAFDIAEVLRVFPYLKQFATLAIPKKINPDLEGVLNLAVEQNYMVRSIVQQSSLTDTDAAVRKFNWDESIVVE